jgi:hypothetical protein
MVCSWPTCSATFGYDPASHVVTDNADGGSNHPVIRCTADRANCLGLYFRSSAMPGAYYYLHSEGPNAYNGMTGAYVEQVTSPAGNVGAGGTTQLDYAVYLAAGDLSTVESALDTLDAAVR